MTSKYRQPKPRRVMGRIRIRTTGSWSYVAVQDTALFVDHEEGVRLVAPSTTNDSPEARRGWPGCSLSVDEDDDKVVVNRVESAEREVRL